MRGHTFCQNCATYIVNGCMGEHGVCHFCEDALLRYGHEFNIWMEVPYNGTKAERERCVAMMNWAIGEGFLVRPKKCSRCRKFGSLSKRGNVIAIHGHHPDYRFPFLIVWLCGKCHTLEHMRIDGLISI